MFSFDGGRHSLDSRREAEYPGGDRYDIDPKKTTLARERGIFAYDSLEAVLSDERVDLVTVAIPNDSHIGTVIAALKAGKKLDAYRTGGAHNSYSGIFIHCLISVSLFCRLQPLRLTRGRYYTHFALKGKSKCLFLFEFCLLIKAKSQRLTQ